MINFRDTLRINSFGHLEIGGADCVELCESFPTPLYVLDEAYIRTMMRVYRRALEEEYGGNGLVLYASKAFSAEAVYAIAREEQIGVDVVSGGELYTALKAGFPAEKICMHGNNKLDREIEEAVISGVGLIVVDGDGEAERIARVAKKTGRKQHVLLRINPGVEAHTHAFVQTATTDSKFGVSGERAFDAIRRILAEENLVLEGFHCHIGSQIFEKQSFVVAAEKCLDFIQTVKKTFGFEAKTLNLGGGFGVWYTEKDRVLPAEGYREYLSALISAVKDGCRARSLSLPRLMIEPGRSIVGEAGITLYTVGEIKEIPGVKKYVAVDGGMFDNPRYCLYRSEYTAILANRAAEEPCELVTVAGKCCESGDIVVEHANLPKARRGDLLAVFTTGAYNYSMASNYNRNFVPPVVLVSNGKAEYIVKPQTYEDIVRNDVLPERFKVR